MTGWLSLIFNYDYLKQGSSSKEESWQSTLDSWFKSPNILHLQFSLCVKRDRLFLSWQKVVNAQYKQSEITLHKIIPYK